MRVPVARGRRVNLFRVRGRSPRILVHEGSRVAAIRAREDQGSRSGWVDGVLLLLAARTYEEGFPLETRIPGFRDSAILVSGGTGEDTIYSSIAQYRPEELISVSGSCTGTSRYTSKPERPCYGPR